MIDLSGIARQLHLSLDQIRLAADLLEQGYAPTFISRYRADETGSLSKSVLWRLKLYIDHQKRLDVARQRVSKQLPKDVGLDPEANRCIENARTVVAIESVLKSFRARRALEQSQERDGSAGKLLEKMLTYTGPAVDDVVGWASREVNGQEEEGKQALAQVTRLLGSLMQCDTALTARLRQAIQRRANIRVEDPPMASGASESVDVKAPMLESSSPAETHPDSAVVDAKSEASGSPEVDLDDATAQSCMTDELGELQDAPAEHVDSSQHLEATSDGSESELHDDHSDHDHHDDASAGTEGSDAKGTGSKRNASKLTPRQRRRRWLTSMLAPMRSIKKPLNRLTAYQHLMLGRGTRSQLICTPLEYDRTHLADIARDSFTDAKHPFAAWFSSAAAQILETGLLAKLETEALAELEEEASESLLEHATDELRQQLMRRPVRGHTIALVDTVGPKTVSLVIIDPQGKVLCSDELPCSVQPEVVNQNVVKLGELIHKHRVTLVALTNGPARRFMVSTLRELMVQSKDSGLRWTMADRSGAEAYAGGRIGLKELATYNRRERAAIWSARCLQNPLLELLKVETSRLRLGSYQRELPQEPLKQLIHDTIVDCVCTRGVDVLHASENELQYIPGIDTHQAKSIVKLTASGQVDNRGKLKELVSDWPEMNQRQAMGWLRVFAGTNPLDATLIHPEDYRLAERLIENTELTTPESAPPGWTKRSVVAQDAPSTPVTDAVEVTTEANAASPSSEAEQGQTDTGAGVESAQDDATSASEVNAEASEMQTEAESVVSAESPEVELAFTPAASVATEVPAHTIAPEYPEQVVAAVAAAPLVDAEKLAKQWQVGRAKLKTLAAALQEPFADPRLQEPPVPLRADLPMLDTLEPDTCVWAIVVGVADFGAFVELGPNCSGLIHISRLSPHFIEDPHQCVQVGDLLMTWVVSVDKKKNRVALTALSPAQRAEVQAAADLRKAQAEEERSNRYPARGGDRGPRREGQQGQAQRQGQGAGQGQGGQRSEQGYQSRRTDGGGQRSSAGGPRTGGQQAGGKPNRNDRSGGRDRGQAGGGRPGRGRGDSSGERHSKTVVVKSKKPVAPISDAMKEGDEPLRSFSDLMQFYESKRTTPEEIEIAAPPVTSSEVPSVAEPTDSQESAVASDNDQAN